MFSTHVKNLPLDKLHPDLDKRLLFYKRVLGPVGHANSEKLGWWVSEDYIHALETDPEPLRALLKLLYDEH